MGFDRMKAEIKEELNMLSIRFESHFQDSIEYNEGLRIR